MVNFRGHSFGDDDFESEVYGAGFHWCVLMCTCMCWQGVTLDITSLPDLHSGEIKSPENRGTAAKISRGKQSERNCAEMALLPTTGGARERER